MTLTEIARLRLSNQAVSHTRFKTPAEVVHWLGAVQAQDYLASLWAICLRLPEATEPDVEAAIANRSLLRTWPMRGTIHYVPANDARWMVETLAPRVITRAAGRYRQLELTPEIFGRSQDLMLEVLEDGLPKTRTVLYAVLEEAGIPTGAGRGMHILGYLAQKGLICFGPREGKQPTFVSLERWVSNPARLEREAALAEIARRYFRSHGPATLQDFVWWTGLTVAEAKAAVDLLRGELIKVEVAGQTYCFYEPDQSPREAPTFLLPFFDEFLVAYKDRSATLEDAHVKRINAGGGLLNPVVVQDSRVVGIWKRTLEKTRVVVEVSPFQMLSKAQKKALEAAAAGYGRFLELESAVEYSA